MKLSTANILKSGVAPLVLGVALLASPVMGQDAASPTKADVATTDKTDKGNAQDNVIVVTGSISRNRAAATASPITSLSADDLAKRGQTTISDALQTLSANNAGTIGSNWSALGGFATGAAAVSLRGFNDGYTLTLFDGQRTAFYPLPDDGYRNIVDLNTIPDSIVDRIDVLQDGESATYGSDAIAGVVNVIIKKEIQGLHINVSNAISQRGDTGEQRADITYGRGKLSRDGYNFYINAEWQKNDPLYFSQRGFPYNTSNQSSICGVADGLGTVDAGQKTCLLNNDANGVQADGTYLGFNNTRIPYVQPYDATSLNALGPFQFLNPAVGCGSLTTYTLTPSQLANSPTGGQPSVVCQEDPQAKYGQYLPKIIRYGANARFTKDFGSAQAYIMFNFAETKTSSSSAPRNFGGQTTYASSTPGGFPISVSRIYLPDYVCPTGVGSIDPVTGFLTASGCNAANGTLNTVNNPFGPGVFARLRETSDRPVTSDTDNRTYRLSGGLSGNFGDGWDYNVNATTSWLDLKIVQNGYINLQGLMNAVAQGTFNFADQDANSAAAWNALEPTAITNSSSKLTHIQGTLGRDFFALPGGKANLTVGASYRFEGVNDPSQNPPNETNPYNRYLSLNAFAASGSRRVWSGFYELSVPILTTLRAKAEGSYDTYSTSYGPSYSRFSPKFEAEFRPIKQLKLRGTYSQGFAVPSIGEAGRVNPAIGFISTNIDCTNAVYTAFCAAHGGANTAYIKGITARGVGSASNPALQPQKSRSFTFGTVIEPTPKLTLTVDYWHTKITNYILPPPANFTDLNQYYLTGQTNFADGFTVLKGTPDSDFPNAQPAALGIIGKYTNSQAETGSGIDISVTGRLPLGNSGWRVISQFNAAYLAKLDQTQADGSVQSYAGTLSPCNISSCSGAPRWRGSWALTFEDSDKASMTWTANYTSGYKNVATDFGDTIGQCQLNAASGSGVPQAFADGATPVTCKTNATFDLDWHASVKVQSHFTLYGDVLNVLNSRPPYDSYGNYGTTGGFNAAWGNANFIGRYFRIGAKVDF